MSEAEEMVPVLDRLGYVVDVALPKSVVHAQSLLHPVAHVWLYNSSGEVLFQLRAGHKAMPGTWDVSAGGHVSMGETPEQAALRELQEELGVTVTEKDLEFIGVTAKGAAVPPPKGQSHRSRDWTYLLHSDADISDFHLLDGEVSEVRWMPLDTIASEISDDTLRASKYSGRDRYVYELMIVEIRKRTEA